jgi:hypothetical protein
MIKMDKTQIKYSELAKGNTIWNNLYNFELDPKKDTKLEKDIQRYYLRLKKAPCLLEEFYPQVGIAETNRSYRLFAIDRLFEIGRENHDLVQIITVSTPKVYAGKMQIVSLEEYYARESRLPK